MSVLLWDVCSQNNQNRVWDWGLEPRSSWTLVGLYQLGSFSCWQAPSLLPSIGADGALVLEDPRVPAVSKVSSIFQPPSEQSNTAYLRRTPVISQDGRTAAAATAERLRVQQLT